MINTISLKLRFLKLKDTATTLCDINFNVKSRVILVDRKNRRTQHHSGYTQITQISNL